MTVNDAGLLFVFVLCLITIVVWLLAGWYDKRVIYIRWLVIIPSALIVLLDGALLFTSFPDGNFELANLLSIMVRAYTQVLFLVTGIILLWNAIKAGRA